MDTDEWTSVRRRRYLNINVFTPSHDYWNLGLVRITGKASAENIFRLVTARLQEFGIDIERDIISTTTDGAPVMKCFIEKAGCVRQLCLCHGIQLGITDVLYEKKTSRRAKTRGNVNEDVIGDDSNDDSDEHSEPDQDHISDSESDLDSEAESDEEDYCYSIAPRTETSELAGSSIKTTISKVRQLGKLFRKPLNKEYLQKYVREKLKTELELEIDCRTRWSSLFSMLAKFDRITDCVEKAIVDANSEIVITSQDKLIVKALVKVLEPAAATVEILSARDCNLLRARAAIKVMLLQLWRQQNALAKRLALKIRERITQRWEMSAGVLYFLQNASVHNVQQ